MGLIRKKNTDLESEVTKMKGEIERFHKDSSTYQHLERKYVVCRAKLACWWKSGH